MDTMWLITWFVAPMFSAAATAVEAFSLGWYRFDVHDRSRNARHVLVVATAAMLLLHPVAGSAQDAGTLVAVFAHADDETPVAPVLAGYARRGTEVYVIIATDGAQGGAHTTIPRGPELAAVRAEEARCAAGALGIHLPILLGYPDAQLGNYVQDPTRVFKLAEDLSQHLKRLLPGALLTWGPDGGTGHPDHRLVSSVVTQLVRAGAEGATEHLFYASIPVEAMRAANPSRPAIPSLVPLAKYLSVHVPITRADIDAAARAMACHRTQYSEDVVRRLLDAQAENWNGTLSLVPFMPTDGGSDLLPARRHDN